MGIADASLTEAIDVLDEVDNVFTSRVLRGQVSLWVGSGISRTRVPDLRDLLLRLLAHLYGCVSNPNDPNDPAAQALKELLDLADSEIADLNCAPQDWDDIDETLERLVRRYDEALDVRFRQNGHDVDLAREALEIHRVYGDSSLIPDAEHRLVAVLVLEGIFREILTTNWDALIERAHEQTCEDNPDRLHTVVAPQDIPGAEQGTARLTKIHGCARRALAEAIYLPYLVATRSDIQNWLVSDELRPIREEVTTVARRYSVLYLGLSGQDFNIQLSHMSAILTPTSQDAQFDPRLYFSTETIDNTKRQVLRAAYGQERYATRSDEIDRVSVVALYAKPLLGALYIRLLYSKLTTALALSRTRIGNEAADAVLSGLDYLNAVLCEHFDAITDPDARWRSVSDDVTRLVSKFLDVYREGILRPGRWRYHPLSRQHLRQMETAQTDESRLYRIALVVGILAEGQRRGYWQLLLTPTSDTFLSVNTLTGDPIPVFIVVDDMTSPELVEYVLSDLDEEHLIIHAAGYTPNTRRPIRPLRSRLSARTDPESMHTLYVQDLIGHPNGIIEALRDELNTLGVN